MGLVFDHSFSVIHQPTTHGTTYTEPNVLYETFAQCLFVIYSTAS